MIMELSSFMYISVSSEKESKFGMVFDVLIKLWRAIDRQWDSNIDINSSIEPILNERIMTVK